MSHLSEAQHLLACLYTSHHSWLLGQVRKRVNSLADAEDIAAETFVQVVQHRDPSQIREPQAFLTIVAKRLTWRLFRRRNLEQAYCEYMLHQAAQTVPSAEEQLIVRQSLLALDRWMQHLPVPSRLAFLYSMIDGMGHAEIAARLGVSQRTVSRYLEKAMLHCLKARERDAAEWLHD